jgi:hypothetical protein
MDIATIKIVYVIELKQDSGDRIKSYCERQRAKKRRDVYAERNDPHMKEGIKPSFHASSQTGKVVIDAT